MSKLKIYLFALLFLVVSIIITIGLIYLGRLFPGQEYYNPLGVLAGFGPLITSLFFVLIYKRDSLKGVAIKRFKIQSLIVVIIVFILIAVLAKFFHLILDLAELQFNPKPFVIYNADIGFTLHHFSVLLVVLVYTGIGEEFGWRGYLYHKLSGLKWVELVFLLNMIWALWHIPAFLYGIINYNNFIVDFSLFAIFAVELGIVLIYLRLKTGSVIPVMIAHGFWNFFSGNIVWIFIKNSNVMEWPRLITIFVFLPFAIYYYIKGKKLYAENE